MYRLCSIVLFALFLINNQCSAKKVSHVVVNLNNWPIKNANTIVDKNGHHVELNYMTILDVTGTDLQVLNENTNDKLDILYQLDMANNAIKELKPKAFAKLPYLRELNISGNLIESIPRGVFNNIDIRTLDLSSNKINHIEETAFNYMLRLQALYLNNNKISFINNEWFKNSIKLSYINLAGNEITALPAFAFKHLKKQEINLFLTNNSIKFVHPKAFDEMERLGNLRLDYNQIKTLNEKAFENTGSIETLDLDHNEISCFPENLQHVLKGEVIRLEYNNWNCGCLQKVEEYANKNTINVRINMALLNCRLERIEDKIKVINKLLSKYKKVLPNNNGDESTSSSF